MYSLRKFEKTAGGAKSIMARDFPSPEVADSGLALPELKLKATCAASDEKTGVAAWRPVGRLLEIVLPATV